MNTAAAQKIPLIASRRALQKHIQDKKYPEYLIEKISAKSGKKDDTAWPLYLQRAGYAAVAFAIPYSIMAVIAESPRLRANLEGDPSDNDTSKPLSRKVVDFVRWYWGHDDAIPYTEYMEIEQNASTSGSEEISLESDISTVERLEQARIQGQLRDELRVKVETDGDGEERIRTVHSSTPSSDIAKIWNATGSGGDDFSKEAEPRQIYLTFEDDETQASSNVDTAGVPTEVEFNGSEVASPSKALTNLTSVWSAWNHFEGIVSSSDANAASTTTSSSARSTIDQYGSAIEGLKAELEDLEKDLRDPYCIKDRDDMETEIRRVRKEITALKKDRRIQKLKKLVTFSS